MRNLVFRNLSGKGVLFPDESCVPLAGEAAQQRSLAAGAAEGLPCHAVKRCLALRPA